MTLALALGFALQCTTPDAAAGGGLARDEIQRVFVAALPRIKRCYEKRLTAKPLLAGTVVLEITIGADGAVRDARVDKRSLDDDDATTCIIDVGRALVFPHPKDGGQAIVTYPFVFWGWM